MPKFVIDYVNHHKQTKLHNNVIYITKEPIIRSKMRTKNYGTRTMNKELITTNQQKKNLRESTTKNENQK